MKKLLVLLSVIVLLSAWAPAQANFGSPVVFPGAPTGNCASNQLAVNSTSGALFACGPAFTWVAVGVSAPLTIVDANTVQQANGTNTQVLNIYDTLIDASNYRRFSIGTGGGNYFVDLQKLGSPAAKDMFFGNSTGGRMVFRWGPGNSLTGETNGSLTWGNSKGQHLNMSAANADMSGTLTLVAGTASLTFTTAWTAAPSCVASDTAATPVAVQVTTSTTALTLTVPGGANTDTFKYLCLGNPN